ncbi:D-alanyl-D-alanine carboxypeptidase/D-alanyl-D-alanine-endopeptidase [Nocardia sp. CDC153]|uniref:D-alanyl-D-alanine carboxypeptidase/D-alanyl-D-alanine endopeptidase n=1 Tax=Nocardia sp. CDC153 TaxID=3112167 RepID=UPI002DB755FC|nr:D-alanyl-D-alanine carboxypeptidase/D-alanyl-D-alanine-endopeptidase [Nocardia sp. CDC153]MEC3955517.1 D-alanyl-D-alanine carboxypeptidase/D-alanyl-D-alanine-endopeptidase [Nocardia sp. CDC153]
MFGRSKQNIGGLEAKRRRRTWILVSLVLVMALAAAGSVALILKPWTEEFQHGGLTIAAPPPPVKPIPQVAPAPVTAPAATTAGLAAALAPVVGSSDLGSFAASVSDGDTGKVLWTQDADKGMIPSSTAKILTTAAALLTLPDDHRVTTKVVTGSTPGEIVLVGGGDPTITAQPDGKGYYPDAPKLQDLVAQIKASGQRVDSIAVDTSAYTGPNFAPGWENSDIAGGSIAPMDPVMIDGGRLDPLVEYSPRTATPALDAGKKLATELGVDPAKVKVGNAPAGATQLAAVQSAPLRERMLQAMVHSDNVLAEAIGREVAVAIGQEASFTGAVTAMTTVLQAAGFDLNGLKMSDNSGLSTEDHIPPRLLNRVLTVAALPAGAVAQDNSAADPASDKDRSAGSPLAPLLDYLPVAGGTGSLANRYVDRDREGAGWIRAKTGTLSVSSALVGYVLDRDGRVLTFALMSNDRPPEVSRPALDAVANALRNCGCS